MGLLITETDIMIRYYFYNKYSASPNLWIFHFPKIRPQIGVTKILRKIFRLLKRMFFDISNDYSKISTNIPSKVAEFDIEREFIYKKSLPEVTQIPEMFT